MMHYVVDMALAIVDVALASLTLCVGVVVVGVCVGLLDRYALGGPGAARPVASGRGGRIQRSLGKQRRAEELLIWNNTTLSPAGRRNALRALRDDPASIRHLIVETDAAFKRIMVAKEKKASIRTTPPVKAPPRPRAPSVTRTPTPPPPADRYRHHG